MRVNARLDEDRTDKLRQLQSKLRASASEVVKRALDLLHQKQCEGDGAKTRALLSSDFVGCASGPEALSSNYKEHFTQALEDKHQALGDERGSR